MIQHNSTGNNINEMAVMVQQVRAINDRMYATYEQDSTRFVRYIYFPVYEGGLTRVCSRLASPSINNSAIIDTGRG